MFLKQLILTAIFCYLLSVSVYSQCVFHYEEDTAYCASFKALIQSGSHPEWTKLNLLNYGNESYSSISLNTFATIPYIEELLVKGLVRKIKSGAFHGLYQLVELHLFDNNIKVIPAYAFANSTLSVLYIYNSGVEELRPYAFRNLPNIYNINMYGNQIRRIEYNVFNYLDLTYLTLRKNGIREIALNSFYGMDNLNFLSLEENELISFEPQLLIGFSPNLEYLYINRNKLTTITRGMFDELPNLGILLLNINAIKRFDDYSFNKLTELRLLDISNNQLEELQINIFPARGLRELVNLFIHDNRLTFLSSGVLVRLPNLKKISVGGNPWQCPCWDILENYLFNHNITRLCYEIYAKGERPFCVKSEFHPKDCIYDVENTKDVLEVYFDRIHEYGKLPPVCNVDGAPTAFLGN